MLSKPSCREFCKRTADDLPFYYWTADDRYNLDDLPSFNESPQVDDADASDASSHPSMLNQSSFDKSFIQENLKIK